MIFVRIIRTGQLYNYILEGGEDSLDIQAITSLIGSLGFPIAACIACFSMLNKEREEHKTEMSEVTTAIQNNTLALQALKDKLDDRQADDHG